MTDITARVIEIVGTVLSEHHLFRDEPEITADSILDDLRVDDIDKMSIAMRVEEELGFIMSDRQERELSSIQDIITTVHQARLAA